MPVAGRATGEAVPCKAPERPCARPHFMNEAQEPKRTRRKR